MRRLFGVLAAGAATLGLTGCNDTDPLEDGVLTVGMECAYAPYNLITSSSSETAVRTTAGTWCDGYDVMIASEVASQLGVTLEIVASDWDGLIPALNDGRIDAIIAGMSPTETRKEAINFSNPYYTEDTELVVVVASDSDYIGSTQRSDLSGATIGYQSGTWQGDMYDQLPGVTSKTADAYGTLISQTINGQLDGYLAERKVAETHTAADNRLAYISFEDTDSFTLDAAYTSVSIGISKGNTDLLSGINDALATITDATRAEWMAAAILLGSNDE